MITSSETEAAVVMVSREQLIATTFVELADTLVADFDVLGKGPRAQPDKT